MLDPRQKDHGDDEKHKDPKEDEERETAGMMYCLDGNNRYRQRRETPIRTLHRHATEREKGTENGGNRKKVYGKSED